MRQRLAERVRSLGDLWPTGVIGLAFAALAMAVSLSGRGWWMAVLVLLAVPPLSLLLGLDRSRIALPAGLLAGSIIWLQAGIGTVLVPIFIVLAAGFMLSEATKTPAALRRLIPLAFGAGLLSLLLASVVLQPPNNSGRDETNPTRPAEPRDAAAEDDMLTRLIDAIERALGIEGDESQVGQEANVEGQATGAPQNADNPTNWWLLLLLLAVVGLAVFATWLLLRWLRRRQAGETGASRWALLNRFETVGKQAGSERQEAQGLVDYGTKLSQEQDQRPRLAGTALSDLLYDPKATSSETAERLVTDLETTPPDPVAAPPRRRRFVPKWPFRS